MIRRNNGDRFQEYGGSLRVYNLVFNLVSTCFYFSCFSGSRLFSQYGQGVGYVSYFLQEIVQSVWFFFRNRTVFIFMRRMVRILFCKVGNFFVGREQLVSCGRKSQKSKFLFCILVVERVEKCGFQQLQCGLRVITRQISLEVIGFKVILGKGRVLGFIFCLRFWYKVNRFLGFFLMNLVQV